MADTSNCNASGFRRRLALSLALALLALACLPAFAQTTVTNTATVAPPVGVTDPSGGCDTASPPNCTGNNTATDTDTVIVPTLTLTKTHTGDFTVGQNGTYLLTLSNTGTAVTSGTITVTDSLPAGLTFVSATGTGWTCGAVGQDVTCTSTTPIAAGASANPITLIVSVTAAGVPSVTNSARASGGGDPTCPAAPAATQARCTPSDPTNVLQALINAAKSPISVSGPTVAGVYTVDYVVTVSNTGTADGTYGNLVDTPVFPSNTTITGASWTTSGTGAPAGGASGSTGPYQLAPAGTLIAAGAVHTFNLSITFTYNDLVQPPVCAATPTPGTGLYNQTSLPAGQETSTADNATCINPPAPPVFGLELVKTASPTTVTAVGDVITYSFVVRNTGNVTLTNVVVTDSLLTGLSCPAIASLAPSATPTTVTCTGNTYTVTQTDIDTNGGGDGDIDNTATANSDQTAPATSSVAVTLPAQTPAQTLVKALTNDSTGGTVAVGDVLTYTVTLTNTGNTTLTNVVVSDSKITPNTITCASVAPGGTCVLVGTYTVLQSDADAGTISNTAVVTSPVCPTGSTDPSCTTTIVTPVFQTSTSVAKSVDTVGSVNPGDTLTYTLTVTVNDSATLETITLTDTLGAGLTFGAVTVPGAYTCTGGVVCTLPAGTVPGTYAVSYTATVDANATGSVSNAVVASTPPGGDPDPVCATCTTTTAVATTSATVSKTVDPASGTEVRPGQTLTYTLTTVVANSATTEAIALTDTLGAGLTFGAVTNAGAYTCTGSLLCTLPAGTLPGSYAVTYTATVDNDATGSVGNNVTASTPPGGDPDPVCTTCTTENPVARSASTVSKSVDATAPVAPGQTLIYTLTTVVTGSATTDVITLTDTLGTGLTFGVVTSAGVYTCAGSLVCTLPAGTLPGSYAVSYTATVNAGATGTVNNAVVAATPGVDPEPVCSTCATVTPVAPPVVTVAKVSNPASGASVSPGDTIGYTLTVTVANSATTSAVTLTDTLSGDQTLTGTLPAGCASNAGGLICTLAAGTLPGSYTFAYSATVDADASGNVGNVVVPSGSDNPTCDVACATEHPVVSDFELRIRKTASVREVKIGDLVRYTLTVENVGDSALVNGVIVDTPPAGFSYVEGSLSATDGDNAATAVGQSPIRFEGLDIAAGQTATLVYTMRVGAGVRPGVHINQAQAFTLTGTPISNITTAEVMLVADAMIEDSLLMGTVFDDRDSDGWQDRADLSGVRVQGGFAPAAYVPNSTTVDRGAGPQPEADASSPMLHGIAVGAIGARQSVADPVADHQVVIRQRLNELAFTNDFVLTSAQGVTVRMDAAGATTVEKSGEAAKGLNVAEPKVERRVAQGEGGYVVDYVISNLGIDERGIPGVRIASVEGLLIETDQFGRYHLEGTHGGDVGRGRNFILKVDPSTLAPGSVFTTDNPLVRRITQGVPVRFDFGVKMPVEEVQGGEQQVELELGEVIFAPGSAEVRSEYRTVIEQIAAKVVEYRGGEVLISANGDSEALAFDRATAVKSALLQKLPAGIAKALTVSVRADLDDPSSLVVGMAEGGPLLGTVLFDTDKSVVKPRFLPMLDKVAAYLDKLGGGSIAIVGHTDPRASNAYNLALGMRRAKAVYEIIAARLSPQVRAKVRVESSNDPAAPAGTSK